MVHGEHLAAAVERVSARDYQLLEIVELLPAWPLRRLRSLGFGSRVQSSGLRVEGWRFGVEG